MKVLYLIALATLILLLSVPAGMAQTITLANPSGIAERDIIVYYSNGTMQGFYNSTSVITLDSSQDYIFTLKPMRTTPLEEPGSWLTDEAFPFVGSNAIPIIVIVFLATIWFGRRR